MLTFFEVLVAFAGKGFGVEIRHEVWAYLHKVDMFPEIFNFFGVLQHLYIAGVDNFRHAAILITRGFWHYKQHFHAVFSQSLGDTQAGCS